MHFYQTPDDLPSDLMDCVTYGTDNDSPFDWFYHKFYVFFFPTMTPLPIEEMIEKRKEYADEKLKKGNFESYVFSHERAFRMDVFIDLIRSGIFNDGTARTARRFWNMASSVWVDNENDESNPCWTMIVNADVPYRGFMTESRDRRAVRDLPDMVTVYRGVTGKGKAYAFGDGMEGWQWTLDEDVAIFFANRYPKKGIKPFILKMKVPKEKIIAYLTSRNEAEILIEPGSYDESVVEIYTSPARRKRR